MESYCSLCTLDTILRLFFVKRLIINKINKVHWVDFKLENVLASLHSLKNNGSRLHYFEGMELLGHSPIHNVQDCIAVFMITLFAWLYVYSHVKSTYITASFH
jgi:hypothetical protein